MTHDEAAKFFYDFGNVGRSAEDVKSVQPTMPQLRAAEQAAIARGQTKERTREAAMAIIQHGGFSPLANGLT